MAEGRPCVRRHTVLAAFSLLTRVANYASCVQGEGAEIVMLDGLPTPARPSSSDVATKHNVSGHMVWFTALPGAWGRRYPPPPVAGDTGRCPIVSGKALGKKKVPHMPLSIVIGVHRSHLVLGPRTAYHACVDQSNPPDEVVVVVGGVSHAELPAIAQLYWPCQGVLVGTDRLLEPGQARDIGGHVATHHVTSFLDGDDIAGPQWSDAVRYFHAATSFAVLAHGWGKCEHCNFTAAPGSEIRPVSRCPDRCDRSMPHDPFCINGPHWCLNGTRRPLSDERPIHVKCFRADELSRAKVVIMDPMVKGNFPQIAFPHVTVSGYKHAPAKYREDGGRGTEDGRFLRDMNTRLWEESFLGQHLALRDI
eukprot:m.50349 g.50349  ORF g.50349 m.50349 type:complete len:364 (+) comp7233_c0_seq1:116-1207(+)